MIAFLTLHVWAIVCYGSFIFGQFLFLLARANSARKNNATSITSTWQFFRLSAIPIFVRFCMEFFAFILLRHYPGWIIWLVALWGWHLPAGTESAFNQPIFFVFWFFAGYAADSILDKLVYFEKLPAPVRNWIRENVPRNQFYDAVNGAQEAPKIQA